MPQPWRDIPEDEKVREVLSQAMLDTSRVPLMTEREKDPSLLRHITDWAQARLDHDLLTGKLSPESSRFKQTLEAVLDRQGPSSYESAAKTLAKGNSEMGGLAHWAAHTAVNIASGTVLYDRTYRQLYRGFEAIFEAAERWFFQSILHRAAAA